MSDRTLVQLTVVRQFGEQHSWFVFKTNVSFSKFCTLLQEEAGSDVSVGVFTFVDLYDHEHNVNAKNYDTFLVWAQKMRENGAEMDVRIKIYF
jgi:hypothetical protein